jgi:glucose-6-phosphate dehydrogenase assembly protein OpcA
VSTATASPTVPLHDVAGELRRHMNACQEADGTPVVWARMSNLVIYCDKADAAERVSAMVPEVMALHPARVLLLVADRDGPAAPPTASVQICCWRGEGKQRVASEQVTIHVSGHAVDHLAFAVRPLLLGDLPMNLWWASLQPPALAGPLLSELAEGAQQLVYDSFGWLEPAKGVAATSSWLERFERPPESGRWRIASDLNWRRLKYWRRLLGQALDPNTAPGTLESITEILVEHGPHCVVQAWELVSWLAARLQWRVQAGRMQPNVEIAWKATAPQGQITLRIRRLAEGPSELRHMRIACAVDGKRGALDVSVPDGRRLSVIPEGISASPRTLTLPSQELPELVGRQLCDRDEDPVFRQSAAVAQVFAQSLVGETATS